MGVIDTDHLERMEVIKQNLDNHQSKVEQDLATFQNTIRKVTSLEADVNSLKENAKVATMVPSPLHMTEDNGTLASGSATSTLQNAEAGNSEITDNNTIIIMCMDSNAKYLNRRKLWDLDGTEFRTCYTIADINKHIDRKVKYTNLKYFFMSVGCNDLDSRSAEEVFESICDTVTKMKASYPRIKIIISEITPRMDDKDVKVIRTNELLNEYVKGRDMVYITRNSNLRDPKFFYPGDSKHIRQDCIGRFAANIKFTLRLAYGRKKYSWDQSHQNDQYQQHHNRNQHQPPLHAQNTYQHPYPNHQLQQNQQNQQHRQYPNLPNVEQLWLHSGLLNNIISEAVRSHVGKS